MSNSQGINCPSYIFVNLTQVRVVWEKKLQNTHTHKKKNACIALPVDKSLEYFFLLMTDMGGTAQEQCYSWAGALDGKIKQAEQIIGSKPESKIPL